MNKIAAIFVVLMAASGGAYAADQVVYQEAPAGYDWSGAYVGIFAGWAHNESTATDITRRRV